MDHRPGLMVANLSLNGSEILNAIQIMWSVRFVNLGYYLMAYQLTCGVQEKG
jgi:hypothetical protein